MKKAFIGGAALVAVGWVGASFAQIAAQPAAAPVAATWKVIVPARGGSKLANTAPPSRPKLAALGGTEQAALTKQIVASKPANLATAATRNAFTVNAANLRVAGVETLVTAADWVWEGGAQMSSVPGSTVIIRGVPDGAWVVDCTVSTEATAPFEVATESAQNGTVLTSGTSSVAPANGHILFGVYMSGGPTANPTIKYEGNLVRVRRPTGGFYTWGGCTFTPVN